MNTKEFKISEFTNEELEELKMACSIELSNRYIELEKQKQRKRKEQYEGRYYIIDNDLVYITEVNDTLEYCSSASYIKRSTIRGTEGYHFEINKACRELFSGPLTKANIKHDPKDIPINNAKEINKTEALEFILKMFNSIEYEFGFDD